MALNYSISYTFSPSTTISSSQANTNFSDNSNTWNGLEAKTKTFSNLGIDTELKTGGSLLTANGTVAAPSISFTNSTGSGLYRIGADDIGIATAGIIGLEINSAQAVIIRGVANNSSAAAGMVGETIAGSASSVSLSTGTAKTIASISLTPGQWSIVTLQIILAGGATVIADTVCSISTTNNTVAGGALVPDATGQVLAEEDISITSHTGAGHVLPPLISVAKVATTTPYYLVIQGDFSVSTLTATGSITATRTR